MARTEKPTAKRWFEIECRKCGQRFVEMSKLAFHRCPAVDDTREGRDGLRP